MAQSNDPQFPDVTELLKQQAAKEASVQARHDALERLFDAAMTFAPLWVQWARLGSDDSSALAIHVRGAQEKMAGAAVDLFQAQERH